MEWYEALILGIVQGLTEFLPISSSGHIELFLKLFNLTSSSVTFDIVVHMASLIALLIYFKFNYSNFSQENLDIKKAMGVLSDNWEKFVNAKTEEEKLEAVESMVDYGLIERNQWSEKTAGKIYITSNAPGIPYKHFMGGGQGDALTNDMNRIIRENGLEVKLGKSNPRPSTRISRHRAKRYLMFHQVQDYFDALFSVNWNIQIDFNAEITYY